MMYPIRKTLGRKMMGMEGFPELGVWSSVAELLNSSPVAYIAATPFGLSLVYYQIARRLMSCGSKV
jgi:hypothetical protein